MKLICAVLLLFFVSCTDNTPEVKVTKGDAFGTTYYIQYYAERNLEIQKGIDSIIYLVNRSVSTYQPNSDISKINRGDSTVIVDQIFKDNFFISEEVFNITKGYFDPTIGVLRNAYGFGDEKPLVKIDSLILDSLMHYVGFHKVALSSIGLVKKKNPRIYFDFNAVAKGYGIDCIGKFLEQKGITNFLIELGGEILAKGKNLEKNKLWVVGIENIDSSMDNRSYASSVELSDMAMASSGNYRKFRIDSLSGKKYVHIINPITGKAEQGDVTSATVLASSCAIADAYATAFMALGLEKSKLVLKDLSLLEAYLTYTDSSETQQLFLTEGFKKRLLD